MSAFVGIFDRSGAALDPREVRRLTATLATPGTEAATFCRGPLGLAVVHRGGPGAQNRHGPLVVPATGTVVAVAGRFSAVEGSSVANGYEPAACAALALDQADQGEGQRQSRIEDFLAGVCGPFALLVANPAGGWIEVARDHLGSFKTYYFLDRRWLIVASEPVAILGHSAVSDDLDQGSIARFLGFRFGHSERSFFRQIRELPPAHRLRVTTSAAEVTRYWRFRSRDSVGQLVPEEVAGGFLERLRRSLASDVAGLEPEQVALSLSGGLDSTALAALAPRGVRAFSWTFDEVPDGDERPNVEAVSRHLGLPVHWVPGDGLYPLSGDFADLFFDGSSPYVNPFSALKHRLYQAARGAGCQRVLVGDGGDALYAAREYWLRDALGAREPGAIPSLADTVRRAVLGDRFSRQTLGRLLPLRGLGRAIRRDSTPWLTAAGRAALPLEALSPILPPGRRGRRHELIVGVKHTELESEERRLFARCGVERGNPFWSWPLLEMAIHLPAGWYHRDGRAKALTREALRGLLPERVLESEKAGLLGAFFLRGIELHRQQIDDDLFRRPRSDWQRYVRREWLEPYLSATRSIAFGHTILWRTISYELWCRRLTRGQEWAG